MEPGGSTRGPAALKSSGGVAEMAISSTTAGGATTGRKKAATQDAGGRAGIEMLQFGI